MTNNNENKNQNKHNGVFAHDHGEAIWGIVIFVLMIVGMYALSVGMNAG